MQQWKRLLLLIPVAITPPIKQQQMEQVIIMRNYGLDIQAAILEAISKCCKRSDDEQYNVLEQIKYRKQSMVLMELLEITKHITQEISNI